jgi:F-type H+-transporting ATPase subunit c
MIIKNKGETSMKIFNKVATVLGVLLFSTQAFAEGGGFVMGELADGSFLGLMGLGAGVGVGLAAFGAAGGQGKAAAAALDGIARNPSASGKMLVPLVLSLALMESLVILTFLVGSGISGTIGAVLGQ